MAKRKAKKLRLPCATTRWAIMNIDTGLITSVYEKRYGKKYVAGDCFEGQVPVRVRVIPADK